MKSIKNIKKHIEKELAPDLEKYGLKKARDFVFWRKESEVAKIVEIAFLRKVDASYFGSTTASFSILFGGLYGESGFEEEKDFPSEYFCQIRGRLFRDSQQKPPNLRLPEVEHKRRDIWWVGKSKESVQMAIDDARRSIQAQLGTWLDRLSDQDYLCQMLYYEEETETGLWGFGKKGSPARHDAIKRICHGIDADSLSDSKKSFIKWLANKIVRRR